jgi:hypothetical protein
MGQEFGSLLHSSLSCAGQEIVTAQLMRFGADTLAHVAMGMIGAVFVLVRGFDVRWLWAGFGLIVAKEFLGDMPNGEWALLVVLDTVWDLMSYLAGFFILWWGLMAERREGPA